MVTIYENGKMITMTLDEYLEYRARTTAVTTVHYTLS